MLLKQPILHVLNIYKWKGDISDQIILINFIIILLY